MAKRQEIEAARAGRRPADEVQARRARAARPAARRRRRRCRRHTRRRRRCACSSSPRSSRRVEGYSPPMERFPAEELASVRRLLRGRARGLHEGSVHLGEPMLEAIGCVYVRQTQKRMAKMSGGLRGVVGVFEEGAEFVPTCRRASAPSAASSGWRVRRSSCTRTRAAAEGAAGNVRGAEAGARRGRRVGPLPAGADAATSRRRSARLSITLWVRS